LGNIFISLNDDSSVALSFRLTRHEPIFRLRKPEQQIIDPYAIG